jgi:CspA family cold shock protein
MAQGIINSLRSDKGFGFITSDQDRRDIFFHRSAVEGISFDELREGQRVEFTAGRDPRDPARSRAEHVRIVERSELADQFSALDRSDTAP